MKNISFLIGIIVFLALLGGGGYYYYRQGNIPAFTIIRTDIQPADNITASLLERIKIIQSLKLDTALLETAEFKALEAVPIPTLIPPQLGKPNPFLSKRAVGVTR